MNSFSIKRFGMYAKSEIISRRRILLLWLVASFGLFMAAFYINHLSMPKLILNGEYDWVMGYSLAAPYSFSWLFIIGISVVYISIAFKNYFNKLHSTFALVLPASQSEKFIFAALFYTVISPITLFLIASAISAMWAWAYDLPFGFFDLSDCRTFIDVVIALYAFMLAFFYGAVRFRKYQLLFTLISLFVIGMFISYVGYIFHKFDLDLAYIQEWVKQFDRESVRCVIRAILEILGLLTSATLLFMTWCRFRKLQAK